MIPRRRIPLEAADLRDWLRAPFVADAEARRQIGAFEAAFAAMVGVRHARAVASGRDALGLILDGLDLTPGDALVVPAYTLGELLPLLQRRGLRLVPADVDPATMNVTPASVRACLDARTRAILAVHLLGAPCDAPALAALAAEAGAVLIEDCAHAPGARIGGRAVGSFGVAALFSLEASKAVAAFGGGVLATDDERLADYVATRLAARARREWPAMKKTLMRWMEELLVRSPLYGPLARVLFSDRVAAAFERAYRGGNDRARPAAVGFSALQARMATRRLARLEARNARCNALWSDTAARLPARFRPQHRDAIGAPAFYNLVARFDGDLRQLRRAALARGLDLGIFGEVMDDTAAMLGAASCPGAARAHAEAVLLPLYDGLDERRRLRMLRILGELAAGPA